MNTFDFRRVVSNRVFTQNADGFTQAERTNFFYDGKERVKKSDATMIEGISLLVADELRLHTNDYYKTFDFAAESGPRTRTIRDHYVYTPFASPNVGLATSYLERVAADASPGRFTVRQVNKHANMINAV